MVRREVRGRGACEQGGAGEREMGSEG